MINSKQDNFFVVGIGASAGGLRAIEEFVDYMPSDSGAAFVVVQHLSPDFKSLMKELLERRTQMQVHRVEEGIKLQPNNVYLIPPRKNLFVHNGFLSLTEQDVNPRLHPNYPINIFFESLAKDYGDKAIGVILSGSGSDGAQGLPSINEAGGLVFVQSPTTAEFDGMPQSAIATGVVDQVLPPKDLAKLIYDIVQMRKARSPVQDNSTGEIDPKYLKEIIEILNASEKIDFSYYKINTLTRRISRRSSIAGFADLDNYIIRLRDSKEEQNLLLEDLLIGVTSFYRDPEAWKILETKILPNIITHLGDEQLRVWVTACATGEEAYSMVMLLDKVMHQMGKNNSIKVFATDIDTAALAKASEGIYPQGISADIPHQMLDKNFIWRNGNFHISRKIREMIIFAPHNLAKNAGFTRMNLISCRNVLIYMQPYLQQQVLRMLHFSLSTKGILFLGASESPGDISDEFVIFHEKWKLYQKRRDVRLSLMPTTTSNFMTLPTPRFPARKEQGQTLEPLINRAFVTFIRELGATCVLVNEENKLINVIVDCLKILQVPQGTMTQEVTAMLPRELKVPLNTALHRAKNSEKSVTYTDISCYEAKQDKSLNLKVTYHRGETNLDSFFIVLLSESNRVSHPSEASSFQVQEDTTKRILQLEYELQQTRENLQSTIEELETTNEEQQATNEELLASNEELQSTNEELHSVNEELYTVNAEYQSKIQELTQLSSDVENLLQNTNIGVVFLDRELKIRKFTSAATKAINLVNSDLERPLEHITHNLDYE